jgi:hypothetical protein
MTSGQMASVPMRPLGPCCSVENGNDDAFGAFEIALDLLPGAKVEQHIAFRRARPRFSARSASPVIPRPLPAELTLLLRSEAMKVSQGPGIYNLGRGSQADE